MNAIIPTPISLLKESTELSSEDYLIAVVNGKLRRVQVLFTLPGITQGLAGKSVLGNTSTLPASASGVSFQTLEAELGIDALQDQVSDILQGLTLPTYSVQTLAALNAIVPTSGLPFGLVYNDGVNNGLYQWNGAAWVFVGPIAWADLDARLDALELKLADFLGIASFGTVPMATGSNDGDILWKTLLSLGQNQVLSVDFTQASSYQILSTPPNSGVTGDHITTSLVGSALQIESDYTSLWHVGPMTRHRVAPYLTFRAKFDLVSVDKVTYGIGIAFQSPAPAWGSAPSNLDISAEVPNYRVNGNFIVYERDASTNIGTTIQAPITGGSITPVGTEELEMIIAFDETGTGATIVGICAGQLAFRVQGTGFTPGHYVGPMLRAFNVNQTAKIMSFEVITPGVNIPKETYFSAGAAVHGTGKSPLSPFKDFRDLVREDASDTQRGDYKLFLKEGTYIGALPFAGKFIRSLDIRGQVGAKTTIISGVFIPSGSGAFTRPDIPNGPDVWQWTVPLDATTGGGLIQASNGQGLGRSGLVTAGESFDLPFSFFSRESIDQSIITMQALGRNSSSYQTIGPQAGKLLVKYAGVDPNTKNWYYTGYQGLVVDFASAADFNMAKVNLANLDFAFGQTGVVVERGFLQMDQVNVYGVYGNGLQINESIAKIYGGIIEGTLADNVNSQGGLTGPTSPDVPLESWFFGTKMRGCPTGIFLAGVETAGDCSSNHHNHIYSFFGCDFLSGAKDGCGSVGNVLLADCLMADCAQAGAELALEGSSMVLKNCRLEGNKFGLMATCVDPVDMTITLDGVHFRLNVDRNVNYGNLGAATLRSNFHLWYRSGAAPALGDNFTTAILNHRTPIDLTG